MREKLGLTLIALAILIVCVLSMCSCGRGRPTSFGKDELFIVLKIKTSEVEGSCTYVTGSMGSRGGGPFTHSAIVDTCGKFNIGDTILFIKK